ncbi:hypothetical protein H1C71_011781, partial [Ictidomys tridecemlineatus]
MGWGLRIHQHREDKTHWASLWRGQRMQVTNRPPPIHRTAGAKLLRLQEGAICLRWTGQCYAGEGWSECEGSVSVGVTISLTQLGWGWTCSLACAGASHMSTSSPGRSGTILHGYLEQCWDLVQTCSWCTPIMPGRLDPKRGLDACTTGNGLSVAEARGASARGGPAGGVPASLKAAWGGDRGAGDGNLAHSRSQFLPLTHSSLSQKTVLGRRVELSGRPGSTPNPSASARGRA